jgi:hypothetical protein
MDSEAGAALAKTEFDEEVEGELMKAEGAVDLNIHK